MCLYYTVAQPVDYPLTNYRYGTYTGYANVTSGNVIEKQKSISFELSENTVALRGNAFYNTRIGMCAASVLLILADGTIQTLFSMQGNEYDLFDLLNVYLYLKK